MGHLSLSLSSIEEEEAVARANGLKYGLGASVFTENLYKRLRMAADIEAGMVWINSSQDCDFRVLLAASSKVALVENWAKLAWKLTLRSKLFTSILEAGCRLA